MTRKRKRTADRSVQREPIRIRFPLPVLCSQGQEFVFRLLKNPGEAEDVTQNIFLRVWEKRRELGGTRSLRSYLYTMARNAAVFDIFSHSIVEDKYMQEINSAAERRDAPLSEKIETEGSWRCSSPSPWTACPNSAAGFSA